MTDAVVPRTEDFDEIAALLALAFHTDPDPELQAIERPVFEPERSLLVRDGRTAVAHAGAFGRDLAVPGADVPAAHVSMVAVAPTHRRRGLLSGLMRRQLREIRDAGREPVAVLWASEGRIYPRFGYGSAAQRLALSADTTGLRLPDPTPAEGTLRLDRPAGHADELARLYERARADRPGWSRRDERWWAYVLADLKSRREGATERRVLLHDGPDGPDGYALYRTRDEWVGDVPRSEVRVGEVVALTPEAYLALWRLLLSVDLTRRLSFPIAAVDEPLLRLVDEPRQLAPQLADGLWVRVVDVPAAFAARRYAADVDVVVEVVDALLPENTGRWRLVGGPDGAECATTTAPAALACDVRALGELYLGGTTPAALAATGRLRELIPGTLTRLTPAFTWHRAPTPMENF
ncbi:GNAT family N-acetyltransferase [Micromonospora sp. WMMD980]|uniref:GNAT family N-acetyltransferase n=1 Tax=Micromonospora sp. WMMD980 TaxID=3016088 RepID=UPI0024164A2B|nr:GNAT family N-acetyltransferase [Micromonospora sp. WMMD980]MDG4799129.1 GNAT family N-acetyltransferase [Micromonospora sp. WMMD980]